MQEQQKEISCVPKLHRINSNLQDQFHSEREGAWEYQCDSLYIYRH